MMVEKIIIKKIIKCSHTLIGSSILAIWCQENGVNSQQLELAYIEARKLTTEEWKSNHEPNI